jgi:O-antigen ligase
MTDMPGPPNQLQDRWIPELLVLGFLFVAFSTHFLEWHIIGRIRYLEIGFCLVGIGWFLTRLTYRLPKKLAMVLLMLTAYLGCLVLTDLYRHTDPHDYLRGWAKVAVFAGNILAFQVILKNEEHRFLLLTVALVMGFYLKIYFLPHPFIALGKYWKVGYAFPTTCLGVLLVQSQQHLVFRVAGLLFLSLLNIAFDYRSLAVFTLMTAAALVAAKLLKIIRSNPGRKIVLMVNLPNVLISIFAFMVVLYAIYNLSYEHRIINVGQRLFTSAQRNPLLGRLNLVAGVQTALQSPIVGLGSWPRDEEVVRSLKQLYRHLGLQPPEFPGNRIPIHSMLLRGWVENGIVGLAFWILILTIAFQALWRCIATDHNRLPLYGFFLFAFSWDILFSEFSFNTRFLCAFYFVLAVHILLTNPSDQSMDACGSPKTPIVPSGRSGVGANRGLEQPSG